MRFSLALGWCLVLAQVSQAAEPSPLTLVPSTFPVVIHLRGIERAKERVLNTVENALPAGDTAAALFRQIKEQVDGAMKGNLLPGRSLQGLQKDGHIFLALGELPDDPNDLPTALVLIARVANYAAFRDGLLTKDEQADLVKRDGYEKATIADKPVFFVERDGYAIVTLRRNLAEQLGKARPGLDRKLEQDAGREFLDSDLSVYINAAEVGKQYGAVLIKMREEIEGQFDNKDSPFANSPEMIALFKELVKGTVQFLNDSQFVLVTARAESQGLKMHARIRVGPTTKTGKLLASEQPDALEEITDLPLSQGSFLASKPAKGTVWRAIEQSLTTALAGRKPLKEAAEKELAAGITLQLHANRDRLGTEGIAVSKCASPEKLVESNLGLYQEIKAGDAAGGNLILSEKPVVTTSAQTYRGFVLHHARLTYDLEKSAEGTFVTPAFLRLQLKGDDEGNVWFGTDGKLFAEIHAPSWRAAKSHLDAYLDREDNRLGNSAAYRLARKQLPAKVSVLFVEETSVYSQIMLDQFATTNKKARQTLPKPKAGREAFWGWALALQNQEVSLDAWIPGKVARDYFIALGMGGDK